MAKSDLQDSYPVNLIGGLDFVTAKPFAEPGTMSDCLNFEVGYLPGYKNIDGLEPFDGRISPSTAYTSLGVIKYTTASLVGSPLAGHVFIQGHDKPIGYIAAGGGAGSDTFMEIAIMNMDEFYQAEVGVTLTNAAGTSTATLSARQSIQNLLGASTSNFSNHKTLYASLDDEIDPTRGGAYMEDGGTSWKYTPILGLQWYKERLYAIQDYNQFYVKEPTVPLYAGDVLHYSGGPFDVTVRDCTLLSGNVPDGDAKYVVLGRPKPDEFVNGSNRTVDIQRNGSNVGTAIVQKDATGFTDIPNTWAAGMWRSTSLEQADNVEADQGWEALDLGYKFNFINGDDYGTPAGPPPKVGRTTTAVEVPVSSSTSTLHFGSATAGASTTLGGGAATALEAVSTADTKYVQSRIFSSPPNPNYVITLGSLDLSTIPEDAVITGIEVGVRGYVTVVAVNPSVFQLKFSLAGAQTRATSPLTAINTTYTVGGEGDLWGMAPSRADLGTMSFVVTPLQGSRTGMDTTYRLDEVTIKIYYQTTVGQLYFWNGTDDVQATIVNYNLDSGDWTTGTAAGEMHVINVTAVGSATRNTILAGDQIRTAAGGLGTKVANIASDMAVAGLAPFYKLQDRNSKYQLITHNFFANEDWDAIYGVNGAERGFTYDSYYMRYLYAPGLTNKTDKPRHIAPHQESLGLGYKSGALVLSVVGEPENFSGVDGAVEFDVGDEITGLSRMNGTTLGIFGKNSISGLVGSSPEDFSLMVLSPYEGAIEYTVVDVGKTIYTSYKGISIFDQTNAYGDFLGNRLSYNVSPWLLPRLDGELGNLSGDQSDAAAGRGPVCAIPVRYKNQYRLYFLDGYCLTMTLVGAEQKPAFTIQKLFDGKDGYDTGFPLVPYGYCSIIDEEGKERIHISSYNPIDTDALDSRHFVYELDKGWFFRDNSSDNKIAGYIVLNHNFLDGKNEFDTIKNIAFHGLSKGLGVHYVTVINDYNTVFPDRTTYPLRFATLNLPNPATYPATGPLTFNPAFDMVHPGIRGRSFSIKVESDTGAQPPSVLQFLMIGATKGKGDI